jgi:hypothetical protein
VIIPRLFFGESGGNGLLQVDDGFTDDGVAIVLVAETVPAAPAGVGGDARFIALYFVVTHTMAVTLRVTPVLDGVAIDAEAKDIVLAAETDRVSVPVKVPLSIGALRADLTEWGRFGMRGTWFAARITTPNGLAAGGLIVDGFELEHEVLRETKAVAS